MISKSLSTSEKFAALVTEAGPLAEFCQLIYPLIVAHADDFGRIQGDPFTIKMMCFPVSPRSVDEFSRALAHLHSVGLIQRYEVAAKRYIQIENFDPHQLGLHKRTKSVFPDIPGDSGKFREIPGQEKGTEGKGTEGKRTEQNLTTEQIQDAKFKVASGGRGSITAVPSPTPDSRSNRPVYKGLRFVVFDWQLDDLSRLLGPHYEDFGLDLWFQEVDRELVATKVMVPQRDKGAWLQERCINEARKRGIAVMDGKPHKQTTAELAEAVRAAMVAAGEM